MYVDCNHFCHLLFLSLWSKHLTTYWSVLEKNVSPWEKTVWSMGFYPMKKDCLVYWVLPHEKRLSGLLGFYPIKKDCLVYCVLPHEKRLSGLLGFTPQKRLSCLLGILPHEKRLYGLLGFTPWHEKDWSIGFYPMKKTGLFGFTPIFFSLVGTFLGKNCWQMKHIMPQTNQD